MGYTRRTTLNLLSAGCMAGFAGCGSLFFGINQSYAPVVLENNHNTEHTIFVEVTSPPDDRPGYTEYFTETKTVAAAERFSYDDALPYPDYVPDVFARVVVDDEQEAQTTFSFDMRELHVRITETEQIEIEPVGKV